MNKCEKNMKLVKENDLRLSILSKIFVAFMCFVGGMICFIVAIW